ncbi:MAG: biotin/lipoyl-containing protein [Caulobacterales bacterium]
MLPQTGEIAMPKLGLTMTEGTIAEWLVGPGETFEEGALIVLVETDKITNEVPASSAGAMLEHLHPAGATVAVGEPIARVRYGQNGSVAAVAQSSEKPKPAKALAAAPERAASTQPLTTKPVVSSSMPDPGARIRATPYAKRLAREAGVDVRKFAPLNPGGRLYARDVEKFIATQAAGLHAVRSITVGRRVKISEALGLLAELPKRAADTKFQLVDLIALAVMRACERNIAVVRGFSSEAAISHVRANPHATLASLARELHDAAAPASAIEGEQPITLRDLSGSAMFVVAEDVNDARDIVLTFSAPDPADLSNSRGEQMMTLTATAARINGFSAAPNILEAVCDHIENPLCLLVASS